MSFSNFTFNFIFISITIFILLTIFILNLLLLFWAVQFHFVAILIVLDILILTNILLFVFYTFLIQVGLGYNVAVVLSLIAACDTCVGLALFVTHFRLTGQTNFGYETNKLFK